MAAARWHCLFSRQQDRDSRGLRDVLRPPEPDVLLCSEYPEDRCRAISAAITQIPRVHVGRSCGVSLGRTSLCRRNFQIFSPTSGKPLRVTRYLGSRRAGAAATQPVLSIPAGTTASPAGHTNVISMAGTCYTTCACGVGDGGMDHNVSNIPMPSKPAPKSTGSSAEDLSSMLPTSSWARIGSFAGNNINVPCPLGTTDPAQDSGTASVNGPDFANVDPGTWPLAPVPIFPDAVPGMLNPNGSFSKCATGKPVLGTGALSGLGPWFAGAGPSSGLQTHELRASWTITTSRQRRIITAERVTVIERVKNFNLTANYTYSHTIDNGNFTTFINLPPNQFDYARKRQFEPGCSPSPGDELHRDGTRELVAGGNFVRSAASSRCSPAGPSRSSTGPIP